MRNSVLILVLFVVLGCGDGAPRWPTDTKLTANNVTGTTVVLEWPAPVDSDGIKAYSVRQNDTLLAQIEGNVTRYEVADLSGMTDYRFDVAALDNEGNWSPPISIKVRTGDSEPPTWPDDAAVEAALESKGPLGTKVTLTWSEATDNVGVTKYRIAKEDEVLGEVDAAGREFVYQSIGVDGSYVVEAGDAAGNWTTNGPSARVWARSGIRPMLQDKGLLNRRMPGWVPAPMPMLKPDAMQINQ